jgi:hypothetical protein
VEIGAREGKEEEYRSSSRRVGGEGGGAAAVEGRGATPSFHDSNLCERSSYCGVRNEKGEVKGRSRNSEGSRVPPPPSRRDAVGTRKALESRRRRCWNHDFRIRGSELDELDETEDGASLIDVAHLLAQ